MVKSRAECESHFTELRQIIPAAAVAPGRCGSHWIEMVKFDEATSANAYERWLNVNAEPFSPPGDYAFLYSERFGVVMSDTYNELALAEQFVRAAHGRVLITGLGLGIIPNALLKKPEITHIDIIELEADVIALASSSITDERAVVHHADAYSWFPPKGAKWDFAFHDIIYDGVSIAQGNAKLKSRYSSLVTQQFGFGEGEDWAGGI